ncbi:MAG: recombinase family protein [Candidatus Pacebacteria bacterium]|nr:recombinase family protein [Candidatus Paceibacterota bacterium]
MNVIVWARVSSREQREGYSLDAQLRAARERATKNGWTVLKEFVVAESARRGAERVAFNEMFQWVKANAKRDGIKAILSHKLDRVCRNMRDAVRLQELEDTCGVHLAFVENQFGPGAAGALSFNVMAAVAQYYSDNLRNEVLKGMDEKVRQGWPTGLAPFGYQNVENRNEPVVPHPVESIAVARIFELYSSGNWTFKSLGDQLEREGIIYRPSQPRFTSSALSKILNNRFYMGQIIRRGQAFPGKYRALIDRSVFEACQQLLHGKNRRTGNPEIMLSGGILRCAHCGHAITGEFIRRKLRCGGVNVHTYYKCGNNNQAPEHPKVRWREEAVEEALLHEFLALKLPTPESAEWFRTALRAGFANVDENQRRQKQMLGKRTTELVNMQDRLLNGYLAGAIDEAVFNRKSTELKAQAVETQSALEKADAYDPEAAERALSVFDFSQNLAERWRGSNYSVRREILLCVSSNRLLGTTTLELQKRKPFDALAEDLVLKIGRGDCTDFEPTSFIDSFLRPPEPHILTAARLERENTFC